VLGIAQLLEIKLQTPEIFTPLLKELQGSSVDFTKFRSAPHTATPDKKFSEAWWLEDDGELFIPQSVSYHVIAMPAHNN
jgi:hypothetical protein